MIGRCPGLLAIFAVARLLTGLIENEGQSRKSAIERQIQVGPGQQPVARLVDEVPPCRGEKVGAAGGRLEVTVVPGCAGELHEKQYRTGAAAVYRVGRRNGALLLRTVRLRQPIDTPLILPLRALYPLSRTDGRAQEIPVGSQSRPYGCSGAWIPDPERGNGGCREGARP